MINLKKEKIDLKKRLEPYELELIDNIFFSCYHQFKKFGLKHVLKILGYNPLFINSKNVIDYMNILHALKMLEYKKSIIKTVFEVEKNGNIWKHIYLK